MLRLKPEVPAADIGRMSGLEIIGTGTTTDRVAVEVAFEWLTELPQTHLVVNGTRLRLNEEETLELASWLSAVRGQCVLAARAVGGHPAAHRRSIGLSAHVASVPEAAGRPRRERTPVPPYPAEVSATWQAFRVKDSRRRRADAERPRTPKRPASPRDQADRTNAAPASLGFRWESRRRVGSSTTCGARPATPRTPRARSSASTAARACALRCPACGTPCAPATRSAASAARRWPPPPPPGRRAGRRATPRLGALRRPRRLHDPLRVARLRGGARPPLPLLRELPHG